MMIILKATHVTVTFLNSSEMKRSPILLSVALPLSLIVFAYSELYCTLDCPIMRQYNPNSQSCENGGTQLESQNQYVHICRHDAWLFLLQ